MVRRRDELIWRPVSGRVVGLDLRSSRYFSLNPTAAVLWDQLGQDAAPDQLAEVLVTRFGIGRPAAEADVEAFLSELRSNGLLTE